MKKICLTSIIMFFVCAVFAQHLKVGALLCEYRTNPLGIEAAHPRFSWKINSSVRNTIQVTYTILVADDLNALKKNIGTVWNSGKINSDASSQVVYKGKRLIAATKYYWKVKVKDNYGHESGWSEIASFQTGLFEKRDWKNATWIGIQDLPDSQKIIPAPSELNKSKKVADNEIIPIIRKEFNARKEIKYAYMYISGLGHFELHLNGKKVGDHFLDPGWTDYQKESIYQTFDVSDQLKTGENAIGVLLGNGFYFTPAKRYRKLKVAYGFPKMICRLAIQYTDGTTEDIVSDDSWQAAKSPIIFSSLYGGEDYDANLEQKGWDVAGFKGNWSKALRVDGPKVLSSCIQEPVKVMQTFTPVRKDDLTALSSVYDFGQNASGIISIKVSGNKGDTIRIVPAELLNEKKEANQKATGSPYYFTYVLKGNGVEQWEPRFSYYGFRFAQVNLIPQNPSEVPKLLSIKMLHIRNAAKESGSFSCSDTLFNKTFDLIKWAIKSNMVSLFTDCPHREKLGWLEQEHLMGNSVQYNFDIAAFLPKIAKDIRLAQTDSGLIPEIAPEFVQFSEPFRDSPEWGSSGILVPWYAYLWYGDRKILEDNYQTMQRYIEYLNRKSKEGVLTQGLSDWFDIGPQKSGFSQLTPQGLTATAIYHYDLLILSKIALLLDHAADAKSYMVKADYVKRAFNDKFYHSDTHQYGTGSQASNSMAVYMQLVAPENKNAVIKNIVDELEKNNYKLTAGDIGFRYLLLVLADAGRSDVIYKMNNRSDVPGYGYQLAHGATALTESWQAYPSVSNNHFMLGHIMEWFYQKLAGITLDSSAVAYKKININPEIVGGISSAQGSYESVYGTIKSSWRKTGNHFSLDVVVPSNTTATIYFPKGNIVKAKEKKTNIVLDRLQKSSGQMLYKIGSGNYHFELDYAKQF